MTVDELAREVLRNTPAPSRQRQDAARRALLETIERHPAPPRRPPVRRLAGAAATVVGITAAGAFLVLARPVGHEAATGQGVLELLAQPRGAEDRLPGPVLERLTQTQFRFDPASVRLARTVGSRRFYVASLRTGSDAIPPADSLCLIDVRRGATARGERWIGGANCQQLSEGNRFLIVSEVPAGQVDRRVGIGSAPRGGLVAGILPPGHARVSMGPVTAEAVNGVFVLDADDLADEVVTDGPRGTIRLGLGEVPLGTPRVRRGRGADAPLEVFRRARTAADALPARALRAFTRSQWRGAGAEASRFAGTSTDGSRFWMIPTSTPGQVVLARVGAAGGSTFSGALLPRVDQPLILQVRPAWRGPFRNPVTFVAGIAADGYRTARVNGKTAAVTNNFFVVRDIPAPGYVTVTLDGPAGTLSHTESTGHPQQRTPFVLRTGP